MTGGAPVVAISGASGYLGRGLCSCFQDHGWRVLRLVRSPRPGQSSDRRYDLADQPDPGLLAGVDVLVHAAYDLRLSRRDEVWRVNVEGTVRLLEAAERAGVGRIILLSSLSAYAGTGQLYGQAKLAIEAAAQALGAVVVRPGLVYGEQPGGMVGTLRRLTRLPLVPLVAARSGLYPVHEDDLASTVVALAAVPDLPPGPIGVAPTEPVPFRTILAALAAADGRRCRFIPLPWQLVYASLRLAELLRFPIPVRADSLLGLVHPAPSVPGREEVSRLGVELRKFAA
ncbi:MAG: NAD-dependent epimerase/dehydratase family protein [Candidatus Dormibacteraeota bacterium]|nr:NAD-dependent epimerase/dehydratase family protein [Candidatus Dormibacteraeota bacterium]